MAFNQKKALKSRRAKTKVGALVTDLMLISNLDSGYNMLGVSNGIAFWFNSKGMICSDRCNLDLVNYDG